jgi:hypothetical protein
MRDFQRFESFKRHIEPPTCRCLKTQVIKRSIRAGRAT